MASILRICQRLIAGTFWLSCIIDLEEKPTNAVINIKAEYEAKYTVVEGD